jgi:hypothetical protein
LIGEETVKKRFILLIILTLSIAGLIFSSPPLQGSAALGDDFFEDFEEPFSGWTATGLWHRENDTSSSFPLPWLPSNEHYMWYGSSSTGNYNTGTTNYGNLTSDQIDLTSFEGRVRVGFWSYAHTEGLPDVDMMWVESSPDNGITWHKLGDVKNSSVSDWEYYSFEFPELFEYYSSSSVRIRFCFDTVDSFGNDFPGWRLDDITISGDPGYFELNIHQGRYALVGEERRIDFEIRSQFNQQTEVVVTIEITTPTGVNETQYISNISDFMEGFGSLHFSIDYKFNYEGPYRVILIVEDTFDGQIYWTDCWWEIGPYFDLWIDQRNYALQYEYGKMDLHIDSHYESGMDVSILINMTRPDGLNDTIFNSIAYVPAHSHYEDWVDYNFTMEGSYQVHMLLISSIDGKRWWTGCWWEIGPYFDIQIFQENDAMIGQTKSMTFQVESLHYGQDVNVHITMELQSGKIIELHTEDRYFTSGEIWDITLSHQFMEPGHHHARVIVTNTTNSMWDRWCCWNVFEQTTEKKLELSINQDYYIGLDEEGFMDFSIDSFFDHGMDIDIKITITTPSGTEELLHEETTYIDAFGYWEYSDSYVFNEEGEYTVLFVVVDDMEVEWKADCWWKVGEPDGDGDGDDGDDDQISPGFEGIFIMGALVISTIMIRRRRK